MQNKNALPLAGFYNTFAPSVSVAIDSMQVYGLGAPNDSVLSPGTSPVTRLYLPFRIDRDTTSYVFRYLHKELAAHDIRDTVTFVYERDPRFVSSACGVSYVFRIGKITHSSFLIDSVTCPSGEISNIDTENLRIYFRVQEESEANVISKE